VIDVRGQIIPNLYCGGESAGGSNQHGLGRTQCQGYIAGVCFWTVRFTGADLELAHEDASVNFSFRADKPPEHRVTIKVIGEDTRAPIGHAQVGLGFYITETDEGGLANFEVPEGTHHLKIWKDGYEGPPMSVEVREDVTIQVEALRTLTEAETEEKVRPLRSFLLGMTTNTTDP
jgi:hypothetical protein